MREHNLGLALRLVAAADRPVSRARIAAETGMTRATASSLVDALLAANLVREVTLPPTARRGRPATGLVLAAGGPPGPGGVGVMGGIGVELNVDYVATTVVDLAGSVVVHDVVLGDQRGRAPREVLAGVASAVRRAITAAARTGVDVCGMAVAVPGLVDAGAGRLLLAPNLGWRDVDVVRLLTRGPRLASLAVSLGNEADFAALGELSSAAPGAPRSFVLVSGEVGVGAGIVVDGRLFRGARGWSGEVGHVTVDATGPPCSCGARGCLELYAGQEAILRRAGLSGNRATVMGGAPTVQSLVQRAEQDDPAVLAALRTAAEALGIAVAALLNLLDVGTVVLGGIYAPLAPWLQPVIEEELAERVLWARLAPPEVHTSALGPEAAVLGAARSVVAGVVADPARWLAGRTPAS